MLPTHAALPVAVALLLVSCRTASTPDPHDLANACMTVSNGSETLAANPAGTEFRFDRTASPARFFLKAADLGVLLLHDHDEGYLVANDEGELRRQDTLVSDALLIDDAYVSGAEWAVEVDEDHLRLRNRRTGGLLTDEGVTFEPAEDCTAPPELSLDAAGTVSRTTFDDGDLYGIVETHAHMMTNWGFGGGGIFHGAPFHRLGVEHALPDCARSHGTAGRTDFIGYAFDQGGADALSFEAAIGGLLRGRLLEDNHITAGYPDFVEWPDAVHRSTHQTMYHRWIERAYLGGLRLIVQHATTNSVLCQLSAGSANLKLRYGCDDMIAVDRSIEEVYAMERYLDAQAGGPGEGWFRVVQSPAEARQVIGQGKLAVVLGIEVSDLFDCRLTPREDGPLCDEAHVTTQLDAYHQRGIRAVFPVHKYDNQFSAGDGDRNFIELGNFLNSGHFSNFVQDGCPDVPSAFDEGPVVFGGLNAPRDEHLAPPAVDLSGFPDDPIATALPHLSRLQEPALKGDHCQQAGLTALGEFLIEQLMARGMIVEIDHLPRHSYVRAFELLEAQAYPAVGTHGNTFDGRLYEIGGISKTRIGRCREPGRSGALLDSLTGRLAQIEAAGGYPAEGFGFDLNGFAGARGGRFEEGACTAPQAGPMTYPFDSYAGDVTFTAPSVGHRAIDFDTEGMVHIGLLPELLQDARLDAASYADLEPLFRSAEGYLRMWERAEARGQALSSR